MGSKSYSRNKELLPKSREREEFVWTCVHDGGHHSTASSLKHSTSRKPTVILPVGGGCRACKKKRILELRSIIKQGRAASGKLFNSDKGKVDLKTTYPHPPPIR